MAESKIPSVKEIRSKAIEINKNKIEKINEKKSKIESILEKRTENRKSWDQDKIDKYQEFLTSLKESHDNMVQAIKELIVERVTKLLTKNPKATSLVILSPELTECEIKFSPSSIYRGFYNKERNMYDRLPHMEAGIKCTPLHQVSRDMKKLGYTIFDISDPAKGRKNVIRVNIRV